MWPRTQWVPEYGRDFTVLKQERACREAVRRGHQRPALEDLAWDAADFAHIAGQQSVSEQQAAREGSPVLICDTDALATAVWERRYAGPSSCGAIGVADALPQRDIYLVTDHADVPFVQDGWRDGEHVREAMTGWFMEELTARGQSWALLTGTLEERVDLARRLTDEALHDRARLSDPIGTGASAPAGSAT